MDDQREPLHLEMMYSILDCLGISLYQKPVDVISELVANAWDADSPKVEIDIDRDAKTITIKDYGAGMTYAECQEGYLQAGRNRRQALDTDVTFGRHRKVLGRKGIGKFAGFGIAESIEITTCSAVSNEVVSFTLDIEGIDPTVSVAEKNIVTNQSVRGKNEEESPGTLVVLGGCSCAFPPKMAETLRKQLARRFVLDCLLSPDDSFEILVDGTSIGNGFDEGRFEYLYPRDLPESQYEKYSVESVDGGGWAHSLVTGNEVVWRIGFFENTIDDSGLQGVSVFARGKLAQAPFFFDAAGGSASEFAKAYLTGQMRMDFVDDEMNLISPERQRIDFEDPAMTGIKQWAQMLIDGLSRMRKESISAKRRESLVEENGPVANLLSKMGPTEKRQVMSILNKMADYSSLSKDRFEDWAHDIIGAYQKGRLYEMLEELSSDAHFEDSEFISMMKEAGMLTDLQFGEAVKTKIRVIEELERRVESFDKENELRDFIAERPWLISPELETAASERSLLKSIESAIGADAILCDDVYHGRIDLLLRNSFDNYTLVEFMRPGKVLDFDHVSRLEQYANAFRINLSSNSKVDLNRCLIIADCSNNPAVQLSMKNKESNTPSLTFRTWAKFLSECGSQYKEQIKIYKARNAEDERIGLL